MSFGIKFSFVVVLSLSSNTTESNSFFKISNRIFEKNRLFFKKMYEMRMKQL